VRYNLGNDGAGAVVWGNRIAYQFVGGNDDGFVGNSRVADLDGDQWPDTIHGDVDVEIPGCTRRCHIYHNPGGTPGGEIVLREEAEMTGVGGWKGAVGLSVDELKGTFDIAPFDIDNDGDIDLVFGRCAGTTVWMNQRIEGGTVFCFGDGSGTACPCGNASTTADKAGCISSIGVGGRLRTTGSASLSADTLGLLASGVPNGPALFFQGTWAEGVGAGSAFGDGLLCVGGSIVRLGVVFAANNTSLCPRPGIDPAISVQAGLAPGSARTYHAWHRDSDLAFCTPGVFNLTNGLAIVWQN